MPRERLLEPHQWVLEAVFVGIRRFCAISVACCYVVGKRIAEGDVDTIGFQKEYRVYQKLGVCVLEVVVCGRSALW